MAKRNFRELLGMEPRVISPEEFPKEVPAQLELEISKCEDKTRLLRILCLLSVVHNGLPKDWYNTMFKEFVDAFGPEELLRLMNLERAGIFHRERPIGFQWRDLRDV